MAAAGLTEVLGGSPEQAENAAEIGIEHNLGLTCDPVGGLVQIPCIERNAVGAVKAITAARIALRGDGQHRVSLDKAIKTMRETGARHEGQIQGDLARRPSPQRRRVLTATTFRESMVHGALPKSAAGRVGANVAPNSEFVGPMGRLPQELKGIEQQRNSNSPTSTVQQHFGTAMTPW